MRYLLVVVLAVPLAGCFKSNEELRAAAVARDDQECQSYGARPGTDAYTQCRATLTQGHETASATFQAAQTIRSSKNY